MTDGAGSPRFVEETPDQLRVLGQPRVQDLDGHAAFKQRVLGKVHFPKAALAEQPDDAVIAKGSACLQRHRFAESMVLRAVARTSGFPRPQRWPQKVLAVDAAVESPVTALGFLASNKRVHHLL